MVLVSVRPRVTSGIGCAAAGETAPPSLVTTMSTNDVIDGPPRPARLVEALAAVQRAFREGGRTVEVYGAVGALGPALAAWTATAKARLAT